MRYDRIWLPDCDIKADTESINRLFTLFEQQKLELAQPAIAAGEVSFQTVRRRPGVVLRYSPYVETMCPLFTRAGLFLVSSTFLNTPLRLGHRPAMAPFLQGQPDRHFGPGGRGAHRAIDAR